MSPPLIGRFWRSAYAFPVACVAAIVLLAFSEVSFRSASNSMERLEAMATARTDIQSLWRQLVDAETGQRGYLLTQRNEYLKPYRESLRRERP